MHPMDAASYSHHDYFSDMDESFSFPCCDFNDEDDESYIEIALEPLPTMAGGDDLKLRVSFSSSRVPLKELFLVDQVSTAHEVLLCSDASSSSSSSSSSKTQACELISSGPWDSVNPKSNYTRRVQFSAINRMVMAFVSSFRIPSPPEETVQVDGNRPRCSSESRKASKVTAAINGSITNIMIKFRSIKIRPMLTSFMKPQPRDKGKTHQQKSSTAHWIDQIPVETFNDRKVGMQVRKKSKGSAGLEINMEAIRGVLEAISTSMNRGGRRKQTKTKSCPGSIKCSPIHEGGVSDSEGRGYSRENSVQAAIAHCKSSFGRTQELPF